MSIQEIVNEKELKQVLWACYNYWDNESKPVDKRIICYKWILKEFKNRYDKEFDESEIIKLVNHGILSVVEKTRGDKQVYYKLNNPSEVREKLMIWGILD
jgi:hypothetical protein